MVAKAYIHGHIIYWYISIYSESQEYQQIVIYNKNYLGSVYDAQLWSLHQHTPGVCTHLLNLFVSEQMKPATLQSPDWIMLHTP